MSTKKVNKYNVKAIRKELDACIRSHSWKRFRTVLKSCCPSFCFDEIGGPRNDHDDAYVKSDERDEVDTCLLQAVVMDRAKSVRETPSSQPTLLNALIDKISSGACTSNSGYSRRAANQHPPPYDIIDVVARHVPQALLVQEGRNGRTPLLLAITRNACPSIINSLIRGDSGKQSLQRMDRRNDNPIISYIKTADVLDFDEGGIGHMLIKDEKGERMLIGSFGKKNQVPLYYLAARELREAGLLHIDEAQLGEDVRIPDTLRYILVKTYNVWNRHRSNSAPLSCDVSRTCDAPLLSVFASATAIPNLFRDFSGRVYAILLHEIKQELGIRQKEGETKLVDERGNTPLHILSEVQNDPQTPLDRALWTPLIEYYPKSVRLPNEDGNLPLHLAILRNNTTGIRDLCNAFPGATQHRNIAGELPLHTFVKRADLFYGRQRRSDVLEILLRGWPDAIVERDGPTGLYPFQLAVHETFNRVRKISTDQTFLVQLSYELLKKRPDLIFAQCPFDGIDEKSCRS